MNFKKSHVEEDIKRQLSLIIRKLKNKSLASKEVSVNRVEMSKNRLKMKVYVGSLKGSIYKKQAIKLLNNALGFIKHEISKNLSLKVVPQIEFLADDSLEYSEHLEELFSKIKEKEKGL